jgi:autotransporter passenger strand-loop-strand repeat protein
MSAIDVKVSAGGILNVFSKGTASNTTVYDGGEFNVNSGGNVEVIAIEKGGSVSILEDVMAENVVVNGGMFSLEQYGWAYHLSSGHTVSSNTIVKNGGQVIVHDSAYLIGAYVSQGGRVDVLSDGTFETGRVNGAEVYAFNGALVSRVDLEDGGILNVESGEFQVSMLTGYSDPVQEMMLSEAITATRQEYLNGSYELYEAWCEGDEEALIQRLAAMDEEERAELDEDELAIYDEYHQKMEVERNAAMVEVAKGYLAEGRKVFFAVGLAHLLGEGGLVHALRDAGFTVTLIDTH